MAVPTSVLVVVPAVCGVQVSVVQVVGVVLVLDRGVTALLAVLMSMFLGGDVRAGQPRVIAVGATEPPPAKQGPQRPGQTEPDQGDDHDARPRRHVDVVGEHHTGQRRQHAQDERESERRPEATGDLLSRRDRHHHQSAHEQQAHRAHGDRDGHRGHDGDEHVVGPDPQPGDPCVVFVLADREELRLQPDAESEDDRRQGDDHPQIGDRHGRDRAEQVRVQRGRRAPGEPGQQDTTGDAAVEEHRESDVGGRAAARPDELDGHRADRCSRDGRPHRRPSGEQAERDAGQRDMADPVTHQREPALHQVGPDRGRREAGQKRREQGALHEVVAEQAHPNRPGRASSPWKWSCGAPAYAFGTGSGPSWTTRPASSTTPRLTSGASSPISCSTSRTVRPDATNVRSARANASWLRRSMPALGSSRTSRSGSPAAARAISTRCCWPPDRPDTLSSVRSDSPTSSMASSTASRSRRVPDRNRPRRANRPDAPTPPTGAGTPAAAVVRCGTYPIRDQSWNAANGVPNRWTSPAVNGTNPTAARTNVDLPEPLAPSSVTTSPDGTVRSTPCRTTRSPSVTTAPRTSTTPSVLVMSSRSPS